MRPSEIIEAGLLVKQASRFNPLTFLRKSKSVPTSTATEELIKAVSSKRPPVKLKFTKSVKPDGLGIRTHLGTGGGNLDVIKHDAAYYIHKSMLHPRDQGFGYGRKMYGRALRHAFEDYNKGTGPRWFVSDFQRRTSPSADRLWESLRKRGYPVRDLNTSSFWQKHNEPASGYHSRFGIDLEDMKSFYKDKNLS